jgi:fibrillarin-like rRNA methylase
MGERRYRDHEVGRTAREESTVWGEERSQSREYRRWRRRRRDGPPAFMM